MKPLAVYESLLTAIYADPVPPHSPREPMPATPGTPRPFLDVLILRNYGAWCLNVYPASSCTAMVAERLDKYLQIQPIARPDIDALTRHMALANARYRKSIPTAGGLEVRAEGSAVFALAAWLERLVPVEYPPTAPEVARTRVEQVRVLTS
jgi:hypothetical protein